MPSPFTLLKMPPLRLGEEYPLFTRVSIETISWCNRACHFCPLAWTVRPKDSMSDRTFTKICDELGSLEFGGVVEMYLLSEPFIDPQILDRARELREACPKATLYVSTNADVLDRAWRKSRRRFLGKLMEAYRAGISVINMCIYDEGPAQAMRFKRMLNAAVKSGVARKGDRSKYVRHPLTRRYLYITDMRPSQQGKAGVTDKIYEKPRQVIDAAKGPKPEPMRRHCHRTQRHIVVRYDGTVPLCCAIDVLDDSLPTIGDVTSSSLVEVWNDALFFKYRAHTQRADRSLPGCETCGHTMGGFPHAVRQVRPTRLQIKEWRKESLDRRSGQE